MYEYMFISQTVIIKGFLQIKKTTKTMFPFFKPHQQWSETCKFKN